MQVSNLASSTTTPADRSTPAPRRCLRVRHERRLPVALLLASTSLAALSLAACSQHEASAAAATGSPAAPNPGAAPTVSVIAVKPETLPVVNEWIATLDGFVNAQIRPQVSGYLIRRTYEEGAAVQKDQVLFEIDARPFRTALAQAARWPRPRPISVVPSATAPATRRSPRSAPSPRASSTTTSRPSWPPRQRSRPPKPPSTPPS
jgi:hypothetical protein